MSETAPPKTIKTLLYEFKRTILTGMKFSFDEFHTLCHSVPQQQNPYDGHQDLDDYGSNEQLRREKMEKITKSLIVQLGGEVLQPGHKFAADYWVYYKRLEKRDFPADRPPMVIPPKYTRLHWLFITECFFAYGRQDEAKFTLDFNN